MDNNRGNSASETIKVGGVDITINIDHHDGGGQQQSDGGYNGPPARKSRTKNIISIIVVFICVFGVISSFWSYSQFTPSTRERTPLAPGTSAKTGYYTDFAGWIDNEHILKRGFESFYSETGVQPYVYITNTVAGSQTVTAQQLDEFAAGLYGELFPDEAHLLLVVFVSGSNYMVSFACGTEAANVIDIEAQHIIRDYLDKNLSYKSYTKSEALNDALSSAGDRMMRITYSPWITLLICGGVAAVLIVLYFRRRKREREIQEAIEAEQTEEMLKIPLEKFGDPEVEELAKKYEDKP